MAAAKPKVVKVKKQRVERTRGGGRYTESEFMGFIRAALRQKSRRWAPIYQCLNAARRPSKSTNKRLRWEFLCAHCGGWFAQKSVSVDHIRPAGSLRTLEDLPQFVATLFCEEDNLQCLCHECHNLKTQKDKKNASE
jgi:5-methylcytosine-specific restriction endonuclease McrA